MTSVILSSLEHLMLRSGVNECLVKNLFLYRFIKWNGITQALVELIDTQLSPTFIIASCLLFNLNNIS